MKRVISYPIASTELIGVNPERDTRIEPALTPCPATTTKIACGSERVGGIEPPASAWKAEVLPLYDTRRGREGESCDEFYQI